MDLARGAEIPTQSDPTPTDRFRTGRPSASIDADPQQPSDPGKTLEARSASTLDPRFTTDVIPRFSIETIRAGRIDADATEMTADGADRDGDRTLSLSGPSAAPAPANPVRTGRPSIPGYDILGKLGEGGMGVVYKARQQGLNRLVALKMIVGGSQARGDLLARFRVEAEAVARLRHPNILQIYDIGEVDGLPFVSLELLEGGDLDDRLAGTPQPGRSGAELMATLARAVHAAHQAGIIHRDLKPANILFTQEGLPKITDFGLAKRLESDSRQTETGQIMGTPSYMAPEQARGHTRDVGPAADIYALGAILYQVLTGRPPFMGETPMETVRQVIDDDPVPPSRLVPRVPRDLETICLKCLQKEPKKRYESAQDLADDLDRYRSGNTIKARRTPVWERGCKWARRRPGKAMAAAVGLLLLVGSISGSLHYLDRRNDHLVQERNRGVNLLARADEAERSGTARPIGIRDGNVSEGHQGRAKTGADLGTGRDEAGVGSRPASDHQRARGRERTRSQGAKPVRQVPGVATERPVAGDAHRRSTLREPDWRRSAPRPMRRWPFMPGMPGPPTPTGPWRIPCRQCSRMPRQPGFARVATTCC